MDWNSFTIGFMTFPVVSVVSIAVYLMANRLLQRHKGLSSLATTQRTSTLSFSSRLIGEIGEEASADEQGPAAKAS